MLFCCQGPGNSSAATSNPTPTPPPGMGVLGRGEGAGSPCRTAGLPALKNNRARKHEAVLPRRGDLEEICAACRQGVSLKVPFLRYERNSLRG